MSKESARDFVKRMQEDTVFAEAFQKLESVKERTAFIKEGGFDFDKEELTVAATELRELNVAGGKCCGWTCELESWGKCNYGGGG